MEVWGIGLNNTISEADNIPESRLCNPHYLVGGDDTMVVTLMKSRQSIRGSCHVRLSLCDLARDRPILG
jgi:hypothetical protein